MNTLANVLQRLRRRALDNNEAYFQVADLLDAYLRHRDAKAFAALVPREMVGNWLHGVAHRTACKLRATIAKRWHKEHEAALIPKKYFEKPDVEQIFLN